MEKPDLDTNVEDQDVIEEEFEEDEEDFDDEDETTDDADEGDDEDSETVDEDSEESSDEQEEKPEDKLTYAFKRKNAQLKKERQKARELELELSKREEELAKLRTSERPIVPEMPDPYDPEFNEKVKARDEALIAQVEYDREVRKQQQAKQNNQQTLQQTRMREVQQMQEVYVERSTNLGIKDTEREAMETVVTDALGPEHATVASYMLRHEQGPLIVKHLSQNPVDLAQLSDKDGVDALSFIIKEIEPKLSKSIKSKKSKAPKPAKTFSGRKSVKKENPFLKGATFE